MTHTRADGWVECVRREERRISTESAGRVPMPPTATQRIAQAGIRTHRLFSPDVAPSHGSNPQWPVAASRLFTVAGAVQASHLLPVYPGLRRAPEAGDKTTVMIGLGQVAVPLG